MILSEIISNAMYLRLPTLSLTVTKNLITFNAYLYSGKPPFSFLRRKKK